MARRIAFLSVLILFIATSNCLCFNLPDTGQTKCYRAVSPYDEIPCAGTGQDGDYNINPMSFTDNADGTVTDNNTGLMWQKQDDGTTYNWYQASGTYDATYNTTLQDVCGSFVLGGYSDWRLSSRKELITIVDYAIPYPLPTIGITYFPNTKSSNYWSSTTYAYYPVRAWSVGFGGGSVSNSFTGKSGTYNYVRCARGGQFVNNTFTDNGNGTVTDNKTGLVWEQDGPGIMTWGSALSYCEGLFLGGKTDWRLPNIKEIESLTDDTRYEPAIDINYFPNTYWAYWSSTTAADRPDYAWEVFFVNGFVIDSQKSSYGSVRCVHSVLPDLVVTSVAFTPANIPRGSSMIITDTIKNRGKGPAGVSITRYYLSKDSIKSKKDTLLNGSSSVQTLDAMASSPGTTAVTILSNTKPGKYYVIACADDTKQVKESKEKNNCSATKKTVMVKK